MFTIGIDVGGTHVRAAAIDFLGRVLCTRRAPTPHDGDGLLDWIATAVRQIQGESECGVASAVGLALPGVVDAARGLLIRSVNLPFLESRPIGVELTEATGIPITMMTDADAATWGEYSNCTPRPKTFVHLRLGTGIACGIVADDRLRSTGVDRTTHWDVLVVDHRPDAIACACGLRGCMETIASGPVLEAKAKSTGYADGLPGLKRAWERHEAASMAIIENCARAIASAIWNLKSQISNGAIVCLGGGVITALPCLVDQTAERLRAADDPRIGATVHPSRLGDDAGIIGAAMLARGAITKSCAQSEPRP